MKRKPFQSWRLLAQAGKRRFAVNTESQSFPDNELWFRPPDFDELVIDQPSVHLERTGARHLHIQIGDVTLSARVDRAGNTRLSVVDGTFIPRTADIVGAAARYVEPKKPRRKR